MRTVFSSPALAMSLIAGIIAARRAIAAGAQRAWMRGYACGRIDGSAARR